MKLVIMCGLPQSGKSTEAKRMGVPIVNRDSIRKTLDPDMPGTIRYFKEEPKVTEIEYIMAESLFNAGHDEIVVDACHLKPAYRNNWKRFAKTRGYGIYFYLVMTSLETCLMRAKRNFPDDPNFPVVIRKMWKSASLEDVHLGSNNQIPEKQSNNWE